MLCSALIDELEEVVFIIDVDTHELLYMNNAGLKYFNVDSIDGLKCYNVLKNSYEQCEFCHKHLLSNDKIYVWEEYNKELDRYLLHKDKLMAWNEKEAIMSIFVDITSQKEQQKNIKESLKNEQIIVECISKLYSLQNYNDVIKLVIKEIGMFLEGDASYVFESANFPGRYSLKYVWKEGFDKATPPENSLRLNIDFEKLFQYRNVRVINDLHNIEKFFRNDYNMFRPLTIKSLVIGNLSIAGKAVGFYIVANPKKDYGVVGTFTDTLAYFLASSIEKKNIDIQRHITEINYKKLYRQFKERSEELEKFQNTVAAGASKNVLDENITMLWGNSYFYTCIGYTKEEYSHKFNNSIKGVVHKSDLDIIDRIYGEILIKHKKSAGEVRFINKSGNTIWTSLKVTLTDDTEKGLPVVNTIYTDITEIKILQSQLEQEKERYKIAVESSKDIILDYNMLNDVMTVYGIKNIVPEIVCEKFQINNYIESLEKNRYCSPKTSEDMIDFFLGKGESRALEIKLFDIPDVSWSWAMLEGTILYDDIGNASRIIAKMRNITEAKLKEQKLKFTSERDRLTKFYTKEKGQAVIEELLQKRNYSSSDVLIILDLDRFSDINNAYGHILGDVMLEEVAQILSDTIGHKDVAVRLGGDEFMLFMCDVDKPSSIGQEICDKVRRIYTGEDRNYQLSCSIGMASVSEDVKSFNQLYQRALSTLFHVKKYGRGNCAIYFESPIDDIIGDENIDKSITEISDLYSNKDDDIISYIFAILESGLDLKSTLHVIFSRISRLFNIKTVSIYEKILEVSTSQALYKWDNVEGFKILSSNIYMVNNDIKNWISKLNPDENILVDKDCLLNLGMSYEDIEKDCHSWFICPIFDQGKYRAIIVYGLNKNSKADDCLFSVLREISKVLFRYVSCVNAESASRAKSEFLSRMSHEIRTPMNAIMGMTSIAKSVHNDGEKVLECLNKIDQSSRYLLSLINDILDMSKIESGSMKLNNGRMSFDNIVNELELLFSSQSETNGIKMIFERQWQDGFVIGDELRLNQVLINIIGNAVKFTPCGGSIRVRIEQISREGKKASYKFMVEDTGIGINDDDIGRIFNQFEQVESVAMSQKGTGLGLPISNSIVKLMGGNIEVESKKGEGSRFLFTITFDIDEKGNGLNSPNNSFFENSSNVKCELEGYNILLVEDNELNIEVAKALLEMTKANVYTALNGLEALDMFSKSEPYFYDVILMDIRMPIMDGLEASIKIRALEREDAKKVPIFAMTANAFDDDFKKSIDSGMNGHLAKPIDTKLLYKTLDDVKNGVY